MVLLTLVLIAAVGGLLYLFLIWNFDHWKKRGVNGPKPLPLIGNYPSLFTQKQNMICDLDDYYRTYKNDEDFVGLFSSRTPQLLITNASLARRVFVSEFKHFHDNELSTIVDEKTDFIFANNPFTQTGEEWKARRSEVTPGLTMSRIKAIYPVTSKICKKMTEYITRKLKSPPKDGLNAKDICLRYTSEVVTDCVIGLNANSFSDEPTPILSMIHKLFEQDFLFIFYMIAVGLVPQIKRFFKIRFVPKPAEKFFVDLMQNAIDIRRSQKDAGHERNDFMEFLLQLQEKKNLSTLGLTARTMTFLLDGFETSAIVMTHLLLLLGRYPEEQEKLRAEIEACEAVNGVLEFDKLNELALLDACIHEAIRIFPPAGVSAKICTEPIELKNKNGRTLQIEIGDVVMLPLYSFMNDEDNYPNATEFKPERFLEENGGLKKYRDMGVYYGFGEGPRVCIGMRFALTQMKAAIVEIVREYNIRINPKTRKDNKLDAKSFFTCLDGGVWLDLEARK